MANKYEIFFKFEGYMTICVAAGKIGDAEAQAKVLFCRMEKELPNLMSITSKQIISIKEFKDELES